MVLISSFILLRRKIPVLTSPHVRSVVNLSSHLQNEATARKSAVLSSYFLPVKCYRINHCRRLTNENKDASDSATSSILVPVSKSSSTALRIKKISKAMKAYLDRAKSHGDFMQQKTEEFEIGKRHLANMMGLDADTITQEDINRAIEYLLPSGLYEPKARPMMRHPEEMFPKEKAAQFDASGRPFSTFFYTRKANFYEVMHQLVEKFNELDAFEDKMLRRGIIEPPSEKLISLSGGEFISVDNVKNMLVENLKDTDYDFLITTLTRLANHPYSFRCKDDIWKFRKDFVDVSTLETLPDLMFDENERPYIEMSSTQKKAIAKVIVRGNGTGKLKINDRDISYFDRLQNREQILFPLELSGMWGSVDVEVTTEGGGPSGQSQAIRYSLAMCLRCFVSPEIRERMRLAGLLTFDRRKRERKKPGQKGARAKYKWLKR